MPQDLPLEALHFTMSGRVARPPAEVYEAVADLAGHTTTTFEFEPLDDGTRTLVTITETGWQVTAAGARNAFRNCQGWTAMLAATKVWLEHGINLRDGVDA